MFFGKGRGRGAVAEPVGGADEAERLVTAGRLREAIDLLNARNRVARDPGVEKRIRRLRNLAGLALLADPPSDPAYPEPARDLPAVGEQSRVPEISPSELTPELLRGSILQNGCLLVRGLMESSRASAMATDIDRVLQIRSALGEGEADPDGYYDELEAEPPHEVTDRSWIEAGGGVLAIDSPRLLFDMLETFEDAGLRSLISSYLGEPPAISAQKCTLRKAGPTVGGAWHQDGKFLGQVRSLNVWLSLSRCGDVAPSMDIVPRRLDDFVPTGTEGAFFPSQVSEAVAEQAASGVGIVRPIFDPGDALLFDDLFLHQTGSDPSMPNSRYAIESWFFGPSAYPEGYVPIAF